MINPEPEIRRLLDLMPASSRMSTKIVSKPTQPQLISSPFPLPWTQDRRVQINFELWSRLPRPQRDLLLLHQVSWLGLIRWFKPDLYQGLAAAGIAGAAFEVFQADAVGVLMAGTMTAIAGLQIWRTSRSSRLEIEADEVALRVAVRRGYDEPDAARHLLAAIESVVAIEGRSGLDFTELIRSQNLRVRAGLSAMEVPETIRQSSD
ncbi:hypothetical protein GEI7407_0192 [Geitlerinema sp. PCC 7407]|nr:hypothetical protein GEI7407_0192 [Geitlerinema sp. PCC 7407]